MLKSCVYDNFVKILVFSHSIDFFLGIFCFLNFVYIYPHLIVIRESKSDHKDRNSSLENDKKSSTVETAGSSAESNDKDDKDQDESTPFLSNDQLPEAELYDGMCGEVRTPAATDSMAGYYTYEVRQLQNYEALERDRL